MVSGRFLRRRYLLGGALLAVVLFLGVAFLIVSGVDDDDPLLELPEGTVVVVFPSSEQIEDLQRVLEARRTEGAPYPSVVEWIDGNREARLLVSEEDEAGWWRHIDPLAWEALLVLLLVSVVLLAALRALRGRL